MKSLTKRLIGPIAAGIIAVISLAGCASHNYKAKTNLEENIKGLNVNTATHEINLFHVDEKKEYVIMKKPITVLLSNGTRYTTDAVIGYDKNAMGNELYSNNGKELTVEYSPKDGQYLAVLPVDPIVVDGETKFYLVDPRKDTKEITELPSKFNVPPAEPLKRDFGVRKRTIHSVEIPNTISLPILGNAYAFEGNYEIYEDSSLEKLVKYENVIVIPTNKELTNDVTLGDGKRAVKGPVYFLIKRFPAPKEEPIAKTEDKKTSMTVKEIIPTSEPVYPTNQKEPEFIEHTVKKGDTAFDIAQSKNMCPEQFANANKDRLKCYDMKPNSWGRCDPIYPGQKLRIWKHRKSRR